MSSHGKKPMSRLMLGAIGVVFGDIGTSPLYTLKEAFHSGVAVTPDNVMGILSMIAWAITIVVTLKYVMVVMKADNQGEGGILALMALAIKVSPEKLKYALAIFGLLGAAMFYGDSMITPAISVLSAVEGLELVNPGLSRFVMPVAFAILLGLFALQKRGTGNIGVFFGPAMAVWFVTLAVLGIAQIVKYPFILMALSPTSALHFAMHSPAMAFVVMASAFLALTGGEALYADMGHFGAKPIEKAWLFIVFPALLLNYMGQGAMVIANPKLLNDPFYNMAPSWALVPLVFMATVATVIASQAVISGAFSMTKQAVQLGYLPRLRIVHTSSAEIGQIYVPFVNGMLFIAVMLLIAGFRSSDNLAAAYGIAVASTMLFTTVFMVVVALYLWKWSTAKTVLVLVPLLALDVVFVVTNASKVIEGGWFPIAAGVVFFTLLTTWKRGRVLLLKKISNDNMGLEALIQSLCGHGHKPVRVEGTAVFLSSVKGVAPTSFHHNLKHNRCLHKVNIFLNITTAPVPFVKNRDKVVVNDLGHGCWEVLATVGFKETSNVPRLLSLAQGLLGTWTYEEMDVSFFVNRERIVATGQEGMSLWREKIFVFLSRNATKAADFFCLPTNRVVEMGSQINI
jgi:KUP system potassium uptake protein